MANVQVGRDPVAVPMMPSGDITLEVPPDKDTAQGASSILSTLLPMVGSMGVMVFMAVSNASSPKALLTSAGMVVAMLGMAGVSMYRQIAGNRDKVMAMRREYLAYLSETRATMRDAASLQRQAMLWQLPAPDSLALITTQGQRLWERDKMNALALQARVGLADQAAAMQPIMPELPPLATPDAVCHSAASRFVSTHEMVSSLPISLVMDRFAHVDLAGDESLTRPLARAMLAHLATFASPELLTIAVLCSPERTPEWEWIKWLPHARSPQTKDAVGPSRLIATSFEELAEQLGESFTARPAFTPRVDMTDWPHLVLLVDGGALPANTRLGSIEGTAGVTVMRMVDRWGALTMPTTARLLCRAARSKMTASGVEIVVLGQAPLMCTADKMTIDEAEAVARRMAQWTPEELSAASPTEVGLVDPKRTADLSELLGIGDVRDFTPERNWVRRSGRDLLRVPFGVSPEGIPVVLDIKESAQGGMGPHGLIIGATGSGKSEVLRTLVLALALTHSPEQLNFVLVDFKGGATFAGMADMPHVSAMISNLESELSLVDRMADALKGEISRRYELLRRAGNYANVTDYEAARVAGKHNEAGLPALFIILDEFSELLTAKPDFIDVFVQIGRVGRSLSIHLLLSSQRLEETKLHGLESHLSYRIGLRTFSASESRTVLGVPDAYNLPPLPGVGYLKPGTDELLRFRACYVAAPPLPRKDDRAGINQAELVVGPPVVLPFTAAPVRLQTGVRS